MRLFCFNDCFPKDGSEHVLINCLCDSLIHYSQIKRRFPISVDGIITDNLPSRVVLNNSDFTLENCISQINHRELRIIAFSNFNKYPIDEKFLIQDEEELIKRNYSVRIGETEHNGLNAKIASENEGFLFSLAIHSDLKKNVLIISDDLNQSFEVANLFGEDSNTGYLSDQIERSLISQLDNFLKLKAIIGDCSHNTRFRKEFESLSVSTQNFLLKEIEFAINRNAKTRFYPDDKLIKNVTPENEKRIQVFELRIFSPVAVRMYFYESPTKIYFGCIEGKSKKKEQTGDILNAASIINELVLLGD